MTVTMIEWMTDRECDPPTFFNSYDSDWVSYSSESDSLTVTDSLSQCHSLSSHSVIVSHWLTQSSVIDSLSHWVTVSVSVVHTHSHSHSVTDSDSDWVSDSLSVKLKAVYIYNNSFILFLD